MQPEDLINVPYSASATLKAKLAWHHFWTPQAGPQTWAWSCPADEVSYMGTRGGGKSDCIIGRNVYGAFTYGKDWNALILRRNYADFGEMRRRWDELIAKGMPATRTGGDTQTNYIRFHDGPARGATIRMSAVPELKKLSGVMGHQYCEIDIDEAPEFPYLAQMIDKLKGCNRSPAGVRCQIFLTGNPGGPGASIAKQMYVPAVPDGGGNPAGNNRVWTMPDGTTRVFIRSRLDENRILVQNDPGYEIKLRGIKDPNLRAAWLEGRWDVFVGQAFDFSERHIIKPIWPIPPYAPLYMTFDWGFGAPFSIGWWWIDADDRAYRFAEWYGCDEYKPNIGLRLTDRAIAEGIIEREVKMGIAGRRIRRLGDPTCQNNKPNYKGGGQGDSTAREWEKFAKFYNTDGSIYNGAGVNPMPYDLNLLPGDPDRLTKIQQFRNRLALPEDPHELPMMVVYDTCKHFIRTIKDLCMDELKPEDIDTDQEDHIYDEACHIAMDRPYGKTPEEIMNDHKKRTLKEKIEQMDGPSREAELERLQIIRDLQQQQEGEIDMYEEAYYDDNTNEIDSLLDDIFPI